MNPSPHPNLSSISSPAAPSHFQTRVDCLLRYGAALVANGLAALFTYLAQSVLRETPFFPFFVAVVLCAYYGGLGPGLLAAALGALIVAAYFLPPIPPLTLPPTGPFLQVVQFLFVSLLISAGVQTQRGMAKHAERLAAMREEALQREQAARMRAELTERRHRELVQGLDAIVWEADAAPLRFTFVSEPAERILGYPVCAWLAEPELWSRIIHPEDRESTVAFCQAATRAGRDHQFEYRTIAAEGRVVWLRDHVRVVRNDAGEVVQLRGVMFDITEQKHTQEALDTLRVAVEASMDGIALLDADERIAYLNRAHAAAYGYDRPEALLGRSWKQLYAEGELQRFEQEIMPILRREGRWRGEAIGRRQDGTAFPQEVSLTAFAKGALVCVVRDTTARKRAEATVALLAEAGRVLVSSLEYEATLERVASLAVPLLADYCAVDLIEDNGWPQRLAVAHADPTRADLARELRRFPPDRKRTTGAPEVLRTGKSVLVSEIQEADIANAAQNDEHLRLIRELGPRSAMIVPLLARGRILGALSFVYAESGRTYGPSDLLLAEDLAGRAALAIDNARLYRNQKEIAHTLQQSLLPPELPQIPGITLAACFRPAGDGNEVGGDFYDLFETNDRAWGVVIGDVTGKGPEAAAVTALVRYTVRATAIHTSEPCKILAALNKALLRQGGDRLVTVAYLRLEPNASGARLVLASGGHVPPLLLREDGQVEMVFQTGMLLGWLPDVELTDQALELRAGDAIVLYTDGVTEARVNHDLFGEERLTAVLQACAGLDAAGIVDRIESAVMAHQGCCARDDIAILVLKVARQAQAQRCQGPGSARPAAGG